MSKYSFELKLEILNRYKEGLGPAGLSNEIEFIEAHHILPLYMGKGRTRKIDLIMLCANCHRAVHNKKWNDKPIDEFLEYMKNKSIKY